MKQTSLRRAILAVQFLLLGQLLALTTPAFQQTLQAQERSGQQMEWWREATEGNKPAGTRSSISDAQLVLLQEYTAFPNQGFRDLLVIPEDLQPLDMAEEVLRSIAFHDNYEDAMKAPWGRRALYAIIGLPRDICAAVFDSAAIGIAALGVFIGGLCGAFVFTYVLWIPAGLMGLLDDEDAGGDLMWETIAFGMTFCSGIVSLPICLGNWMVFRTGTGESPLLYTAVFEVDDGDAEAIAIGPLMMGTEEVSDFSDARIFFPNLKAFQLDRQVNEKKLNKLIERDLPRIRAEREAENDRRAAARADLDRQNGEIDEYNERLQARLDTWNRLAREHNARVREQFDALENSVPTGTLSVMVAGYNEQAHRLNGLAASGTIPDERFPELTLAPARIEARLDIADANGNGVLEAGESAEAVLTVSNTGGNPAWGIVPAWELPDGGEDLKIRLRSESDRRIDQLAPGESGKLSLRLEAGDEWFWADRVSIGAEVTELSGQSPRTVAASIPARAFEPPPLETSVTIRDENRNGMIEAGEKAEITLTVRNTGRVASRLATPEWSVPKDPHATFTPAKDSVPARLEPNASWTTRASFETGREWRRDEPLAIGATPRDAYGSSHEMASASMAALGFREPELQTSILLRDANDDGVLTPGERAEIMCIVRNTGAARAFDLALEWQAPESDANLSVGLPEDNSRDMLEPGAEWRLAGAMHADPEWQWPGGTVELAATVSDLSEATHRQAEARLPALSFDPPVLELARAEWDDNGNGVLERGDRLTVVLGVRNAGGTEARRVRPVLTSTDPDFDPRDPYNEEATIAPDRERQFVWNVRVPANWSVGEGTELPLTVRIQEERSRYNSGEIALGMKLGDRREDARETIVVQVTQTPEAHRAGGLTPAQREAIRQRSHALIVGVNQYLDDPNIGSLDYAVADARALERALTDSRTGLFAPGNVTLLVSGSARSRQPTKANILVELSRLKERLSADDRLLFFFAGHGTTDGATNYLIAQDSRLDVLPLAIRLEEEVLAMLDTCHAGEQIVIIDACHSGLDRRVRATERALGDIDTEVLESFVSTRNGRVVLTSTSQEQESLEDDTLGHGLFTYMLADGMSGAGNTGRLKADVNQDGIVNAREIYQYVDQRIGAWLVEKQRPGVQRPRARFADDGTEIPIAAVE